MQAYSDIEDEDLLYLCGQDIFHKGSIHKKKISLIPNYYSEERAYCNITMLLMRKCTFKKHLTRLPFKEWSSFLRPNGLL